MNGMLGGSRIVSSSKVGLALLQLLSWSLSLSLSLSLYCIYLTGLSVYGLHSPRLFRNVVLKLVDAASACLSRTMRPRRAELALGFVCTGWVCLRRTSPPRADLLGWSPLYPSLSSSISINAAELRHISNSICERPPSLSARNGFVMSLLVIAFSNTPSGAAIVPWGTCAHTHTHRIFHTIYAHHIFTFQTLTLQVLIFLNFCC